MSSQAEQENDEEVVSVPEDLEVGPPDELQGGGDHEEKGHRDDVASDTSRCHKADGDRILKKQTKNITVSTPKALRNSETPPTERSHPHNDFLQVSLALVTYNVL